MRIDFAADDAREIKAAISLYGFLCRFCPIGSFEQRSFGDAIETAIFEQIAAGREAKPCNPARRAFSTWPHEVPILKARSSNAFIQTKIEFFSSRKMQQTLVSDSNRMLHMPEYST